MGIIFLNGINWLVLITYIKFVLFEVGTKCFYLIYIGETENYPEYFESVQ